MAWLNIDNFSASSLLLQKAPAGKSKNLLLIGIVSVGPIADFIQVTNRSARLGLFAVKFSPEAAE